MSSLHFSYGTECSHVEVLFFGPHPDDIELFAGGLVAKLGTMGHSCGLCDLTLGELGSLGTVEERQKEAGAAAAILEVSWRINLRYPDGNLSGQLSALQVEAKPAETKRKPGGATQGFGTLVEFIRKVRPEMIVCPYWIDRHPDHRGASQLVSDAVFYANLRNYSPDLGPPHEVVQVLYYPTRVQVEPSFIVDITESMSLKKRAIRAYASQVSPKDRPGDLPVPLISSELSLSSLEARDAYFGGQIGVPFAEGYLVKSALPVKNPLKHFLEHRAATPLIYLR